MKKTLTVIAIFLSSYSAVALANINFQLNNPTNIKLVLVESASEAGGLHVPHILNPHSTDLSGHSTTTAKESLGYFSYGIDMDNQCFVHYSQSWLFETTYQVNVKPRGKVSCRVEPSDIRKSKKIIHFVVFPN